MFVHSPIDGHLDYFQFGAMMNNVAMNIHAHALSLCGCKFSLKIKVFDFDSKSKNQNQIKKFKVFDFDSSKLVFFSLNAIILNSITMVKFHRKYQYQQDFKRMKSQTGFISVY